LLRVAYTQDSAFLPKFNRYFSLAGVEVLGFVHHDKFTLWSLGFPINGQPDLVGEVEYMSVFPLVDTDF
jgi:hypothetical protein